MPESVRAAALSETCAQVMPPTPVEVRISDPWRKFSAPVCTSWSEEVWDAPVTLDEALVTTWRDEKELSIPLSSRLIVPRECRPSLRRDVIEASAYGPVPAQRASTRTIV